MSESEQALKGTSQIKILSSEDIEGMRVVCRVSLYCTTLVKMKWNLKGKVFACFPFKM